MAALRRQLRDMARRPVRFAGIVVLATMAALALGAPLLSTGTVSAQHPDLALAPPSLHRLELIERLPPQYRARDERVPLAWFAGSLVRGADPTAPLLPLGADSLGRDLWTRLVHGARLSLALTAAGLVGAMLVGVSVGLVAGARGGWLDATLMRVADLFIAWPALYVVLVLRAALPLSLGFESSFVLMAAVLALAGWPVMARAVRGVAAVERTRDHVHAAEAAGASSLWIVRRHLVPAVRPVVATQALLLTPGFVLAEATLSFVGLGFGEPLPSWGTMLKDAAQPYTLQHAPWLLAPAVAIALVTLGAMLAADTEG
jgi:peptide/nickel transport system permease protein